MYRPTTEARSPGQRGYALVLVMVALVTLTILGVTSITASQLDMKITQNMRHHKALQYGALTGQDHARDVAESDSNGMIPLWSSTMIGEADHCTNDWISTEASALHVPVPIDANGFLLSSYAVDFCAGTCGLAPTGTGLSESQQQRRYYTTDMVATGGMLDSTADAQAGALLFATGQVECP